MVNVKYDGIFFDSGGTIFSFKSSGGGSDPSGGEVSAQAPQRAAAALRWLGHPRWETKRWNNTWRIWLR